MKKSGFILVFTFITLMSEAAERPLMKSTYLNVSKCTELVSDPSEEGYWKGECASVGGVRIFKEQGDAREWLSFQRSGDKEPQSISSIGIDRLGFPYLANGVVELRYWVKNEQIVPVGAIFRLRGTDQTSRTVKSIEYLAVISFLNKQTEVVGQVFASDAHANEKARLMLDQKATR